MTNGRTRPGMAMKTGVDLQVLDDLQALRRLEGAIVHLEQVARRRNSCVSVFALQKPFCKTSDRQSGSLHEVSRGNFGCP